MKQYTGFEEKNNLPIFEYDELLDSKRDIWTVTFVPEIDQYTVYNTRNGQRELLNEFNAKHFLLLEDTPINNSLPF